ncbi:hypothetical protein ACFVFS_17585 [Kitasatospora sp. NPDC057692]|uniref:hypothetical protein n=1 Tax=Kitasatospora sp. NPDC057692 TaxID=3346215 RepID=UPI0036958573
MPSALTTITALHVLMATHIELADLPVTWRVEPNGALHVDLIDRSPEGRDAVRSLAAVLGVDTDESEITSNAGQRLLVVSLRHSTVIAGAPVYATAYLPVDAPAEGGAL